MLLTMLAFLMLAFHCAGMVSGRKVGGTFREAVHCVLALKLRLVWLTAAFLPLLTNLTEKGAYQSTSLNPDLVRICNAFVWRGSGVPLTVLEFARDEKVRFSLARPSSFASCSCVHYLVCKGCRCI